MRRPPPRAHALWYHLGAARVPPLLTNLRRSQERQGQGQILVGGGTTFDRACSSALALKDIANASARDHGMCFAYVPQILDGDDHRGPKLRFRASDRYSVLTALGLQG